MNGHPKISVVIPVYRPGQSDFRRAVECLLNQTLRELEFIFVDDCGGTGAMDVVSEYARTDDRIRQIRNETNSGAGFSRNKGIAAARGEYVAFFDADDVCDHDFYEKLYAATSGGRAEIVKGSRKIVYSDGRIETSSLNAEIKKSLGRGEPLFLAFTYEHTTAIYLTKHIRLNGCVYGDSHIGQDTTFLLKAGFYCSEIQFADDAFYHYLKRDYSQTSVKNEKFYEGQLRQVEQKIEFLNGVSAFDEAYCKYCDYFLSLSLQIYRSSLAAGSFPFLFCLSYLRQTHNQLKMVKDWEKKKSFMSRSVRRLDFLGAFGYYCAIRIKSALRGILWK